MILFAVSWVCEVDRDVAVVVAVRGEEGKEGGGSLGFAKVGKTHKKHKKPKRQQEEPSEDVSAPSMQKHSSRVSLTAQRTFNDWLSRLESRYSEG